MTSLTQSFSFYFCKCEHPHHIGSQAAAFALITDSVYLCSLFSDEMIYICEKKPF